MGAPTKVWGGHLLQERCSPDAGPLTGSPSRELAHAGEACGGWGKEVRTGRAINAHPEMPLCHTSPASRHSTALSVTSPTGPTPSARMQIVTASPAQPQIPTHHPTGGRLLNPHLHQAKGQARTGICEYRVNSHLSNLPSPVFLVVLVARRTEIVGGSWTTSPMAVSILLVTKLCTGYTGRSVRGQETTWDSATICQD